MALNNIYLFIGEEKLIIKSKISRVINECKADEYNIVTYDCEEVSIDNAIQDALTLPFMCANKVVLVKNPMFLVNDKTSINHDIQGLINYINSPMETTYLIIDASLLKINEKNEVVKLLRKKGYVNETKAIDDIQFGGWLKRQCDLEGVSIKDDAIKTFYGLVGKDLINAKTEIDKLTTYVGSGGIITVQTVKAVCTKELQNDVFVFSNALLGGNKQKIIKDYLELITIDNDVNRLINLLSKTLRECLLVNAMLQEGSKQADVATRMKTSPNRAYYLVKNAREIPVEKAEEYLCKLADLDYKIKSGQIDAKTGFEFFLFNIN